MMSWIIVIMGLLIIIESVLILRLRYKKIGKNSIPFNSDYQVNMIYIQCVCVDKKLRFMIDTGCSNSVIKEESLNGLPHKKYRRELEQYGLMGNTFTGKLRGMKIEIAKHPFELYCWAVGDETNIPIGFDGLLGSDFFNKYGWCIDYKNKCIIIK